MKTMSKKLGAIILALALCMSLCCTALAANGSGGSITIDNAEVGETYTIYQIFDLTYANDNSSYSYKVVDSWKDFISGYTYTDSSGGTVSLFDLDDNGYLKVDSNIFKEDDNSDVMAAFAQAALAYATDNSISATATQTASSSTVEFSGLNLGYYLVGTTLGSLCSLDSTNPTATIKEKNTPPYPEKEVYDDETDDEYTKEDTAEVGDTLNFEVFLHDVAHSVNLCMHDTMTDGLTFIGLSNPEGTSVEVYVGYPDASVTDLFNDDTTTWTKVDSSAYKENDSCGDNCTFELNFDAEWLNSLSSGAVIKVTYKAIVNENAIDENNIWAIQHNDVVLTYGSAGRSTPADTDTDLVGFNIYKYTTQDGQVIGLDGAQFSLYRDAEHTDIVYFVPIYNGDSIVGYEEVDPTDYEGSGTPTTTIEAGSVYVKGLHEGTYYLTETKAPDGYNLLTSDVVINITLTGNDDEGYTETVTVDGTATDDQTARIENNQGSELPSTGGIGTTIFYIIGGVLVVGAVVVLITRRRMTNNEG